MEDGADISSGTDEPLAGPGIHHLVHLAAAIESRVDRSIVYAEQHRCYVCNPDWTP